MMKNNETKMTFLEKLKSKFKPVGEARDRTVKRNVRTRKIFKIIAIFLRTFILIGLSFVIILPIFEKFVFALRYPTDITDPQVVWIPKRISNVNFKVALDLLKYWPTLTNTAILSFVAMVIQVVASAVAGYSFARLKFKGNNIIFYFILFTLVVPYETLHISRIQFFINTPFFGIKLIGNMFATYILSAFGQGIRSAIFIFLFRQFFRGVPVELEESAQVDGAGVIRTFWSVMLPNARGAIVTVGLFAFVWQWNDYYYASLLKYADTFPLLSVMLGGGVQRLDTVMVMWLGTGKEIAQILNDTGVAKDPLFYGLISNTAALLMMLPLLIAYFFVQKLFVESIERTGITG